MVVPVTGTIPNSTLSPAQVRQKFSSGISGLGDAYCSDGYSCGELADDGTCTSCIPDGTGTTTPITTVPTCGDAFGTFACPTTGGGTTALQPSGQCWPFDPTCGGGAGTVAPSSGASITNTYMSAGGNQIVTYSDGTWSLIGVTGVVTNGSGAPPAAATGTVSAAQANAWPSVINALAAAGVKLGTIALLPAGATLLPNGTIVGSGQRVVTPGLSLNLGSLSTILTNPVVLIGGFGVLALLLLTGGKR